jgi:4-carboxymuconolactone decarboxylase
MRLPIISPAELSAEQQPIYDDMRDGIAKNFQGFVNIRAAVRNMAPLKLWCSG